MCNDLYRCVEVIFFIVLDFKLIRPFWPNKQLSWKCFVVGFVLLMELGIRVRCSNGRVSRSLRYIFNNFFSNLSELHLTTVGILNTNIMPSYINLLLVDGRRDVKVTRHDNLCRNICPNSHLVFFKSNWFESACVL